MTILQDFAADSRGKDAFLLAIASGIGAGFAVTLAIMCLTHIWLFDQSGHPDIMDFLVYWSTGRLVDQGHALVAYNPLVQHATQVATVGHSFKTPFPWVYPPLFLFVAAALGLLPFATAFVVWNCTTLALHCGVIGAITRRRNTILAAAAAPWTMLGMIGGENGLLTSVLVGAVLLTLERRPILSGILLGLLTYKPQFGLLFPFALVFGGYWRTFVWATAASLFWTALSCMVFGTQSILAFLHSASIVAHTHLLTNSGGAWSGDYQSVYGFARWVGASDFISWAIQICVSAACVAGLFRLWRTDADLDLKAAMLAAAIPLATPYVFVYDLPILSVAIAFLYSQRPFDRAEALAFAAAIVSVFGFVWHPYPAGLIACTSVLLIVCHRMPVASKSIGKASADDPNSAPNRSVTSHARSIA